MGPNERTRWLPKKRLTRAQSEPLFVSDGEVTSLKKISTFVGLRISADTLSLRQILLEVFQAQCRLLEKRSLCLS